SSQTIFCSSPPTPSAAEGARPVVLLLLSPSRRPTELRGLCKAFGQAPTRGVTIFLLRNKFLQVVDASLRRRKVRGPVCSVSCVSHFDSARRALNASRTSTHHISTSYRTVANWPSIWPFGQGPSTHP